MRRPQILGIVGLVVLCVPVALALALRGGSPSRTPSTSAPQQAGTPALPPPDAVVLARQDGNDALTIAAERNGIRVTIFDGQARGVNGRSVSVAGAATVPCGRAVTRHRHRPAATCPSSSTAGGSSSPSRETRPMGAQR